MHIDSSYDYVPFHCPTLDESRKHMEEADLHNATFDQVKFASDATKCSWLQFDAHCQQLLCQNNNAKAFNHPQNQCFI